MYAIVGRPQFDQRKQILSNGIQARSCFFPLVLLKILFKSKQTEISIFKQYICTYPLKIDLRRA